MTMAIAASVFAIASCACCNNSENAAEAVVEEVCTGSCADCAGGCDPEALCAACDSLAVEE